MTNLILFFFGSLFLLLKNFEGVGQFNGHFAIFFVLNSHIRLYRLLTLDNLLFDILEWNILIFEGIGLVEQILRFFVKRFELIWLFLRLSLWVSGVLLRCLRHRSLIRRSLLLLFMFASDIATLIFFFVYLFVNLLLVAFWVSRGGGGCLRLGLLDVVYLFLNLILLHFLFQFHLGGRLH